MQKSNKQSMYLILAVLGMLFDIYLYSWISKLLTASDDISNICGVISIAVLVYLNVLFYKFIIKQLN